MRKVPKHITAIMFVCLSVAASAQLAQPAFSRVHSAYEQALELLDDQRYQDAVAKLNQVLAKNPNDVDARVELARAYMDMNQNDQAMAEATRAIQLNPKTDRAYATRAYCEFQRNDLKAGFADSEKVLKLYKINPFDWSIWNTHKNLAHAFKMTHRSKELEAEQQNVRIYTLLNDAENARDDGQLDAAMQKLDAALQLNPKVPDLWYFRGVINDNLIKYAEAVSDFTKAINCSTTPSPVLYYFRGDCYQQMGKHQLAIDDYSKVIQAKPKLVAFRFVCETGRLRNERMRDDTNAVSLGDVYVLRAQSYAALKKNSLASQDLETAAKLDPSDDKALAKKAELTLGSGKFDQAIKDYTRSVAANPLDWTRYKERADAYMQLGKSKEALADLAVVIKLTPNEPGAYMLRAVALKSLKRYDDAIADFSKVLQLRSDDDDAYLERAECYRLLHRYKEALADLNEAAKLLPSNNTFVPEAKAKVLAEMGQSSEKAPAKDAPTPHPNAMQNSPKSDSGVITAVAIAALLLLLVGALAAAKKFRK